MSRPSGIVFNTCDVVRARFVAFEVDESYTTLVPTAAMANGDVSVSITPTFFAQGNSEEADGATLV
jgi:hypothetical protein